jgi:hypothetical protein
MSNQVADLLVVAHLAFVKAEASRDADGVEKAVELAVRALSHPAAPGFFAALDAAHAELNDVSGNDPDTLGNDDSPLNPLAPDPTFEGDEDGDGVPDEDSDAAGPADEGLVKHEAFAVTRRPLVSSAVAAVAARMKK